MKLSIKYVLTVEMEGTAKNIKIAKKDFIDIINDGKGLGGFYESWR